MDQCICEVKGRQCKLARKYPKENPMYCHVHIKKCGKSVQIASQSQRKQEKELPKQIPIALQRKQQKQQKQEKELPTSIEIPLEFKDNNEPIFSWSPGYEPDVDEDLFNIDAILIPVKRPVRIGLIIGDDEHIFVVKGPVTIRQFVDAANEKLLQLVKEYDVENVVRLLGDHIYPETLDLDKGVYWLSCWILDK